MIDERYSPKCRHCGKPMVYTTEGKTRYLFVCENKECEGWHNAVEVLKTKLAERLSSNKDD